MNGIFLLWSQSRGVLSLLLETERGLFGHSASDSDTRATGSFASGELMLFSSLKRYYDPFRPSSSRRSFRRRRNPAYTPEDQCLDWLVSKNVPGYST